MPGVLNNCYVHNPEAGLYQANPVFLDGLLSTESLVNQQTGDGTIIMGPFWSSWGQSTPIEYINGQEVANFYSNQLGVKLGTAEWDTFQNQLFMWGQAAGNAGIPFGDYSSSTAHAAGEDSWVQFFIKPFEGYAISADMVNDLTQQYWDENQVGVDPSEWLTGVTFHNTMSNGGYGNGPYLSPENEVIVRINMVNDYVAQPNDLYIIDFELLNPQLVGQREVTVAFIEDCNTMRDNQQAGFNWPLKLEVIEEPGVEYMNKYKIEDAFVGSGAGATYFAITGDIYETTSQVQYDTILLNLQESIDSSPSANVNLWNITSGTPTTQLAQSLYSTDSVHYFKTEVTAGETKKLATIRVSIEQDSVHGTEWNHAGFVAASEYTSPIQSSIFTTSAEGLFALPSAGTISAHTFSTQSTKFDLGELPSSAIYDEEYYYFTNSSGQEQGVLVAYKFDLYFTETEQGTTLPVSQYPVNYSSLGRNLNQEDFEDNAADCWIYSNLYLENENYINAWGTTVTCVPSQSFINSFQLKPYNLPGTKVSRIGNNVHQGLWIHPDYTCIFSQRGSSSFEVITTHNPDGGFTGGNTGGFVTSVSQNLNAIRSFSTGLTSYKGSFSEYIIPQDGISKSDNVTCEVSGTFGAKFSVELKQGKIIEISSGAGRSTSSSSPTDIELNGGIIPEMPSGVVEIPKSGCYKFKFPDVERLSFSSGWKEFDFILKTDENTIVPHLNKNSENEFIEVKDLEGKSNLLQEVTFNKKIYQLPNVSVGIDFTGLHAGASYVDPHNPTNVEKIGYAKNKNFALPLMPGRIIKDNTKDIQVRITKSSSTFSLNTAVLKAVTDKDGNVVKYNIPKELFVPSVETSATTEIGKIEPGKDNMDIVDFNVQAKVGKGIGDNNVEFASIIGSYTVKRFGLQPQTYTLDLSKIFSNS